MAYGLDQAELAILNAPFESRGWERALLASADSCRSHSAHLLGLGGPLLLPINQLVGPAAAYLHYAQDPALHGVGNWRVASSGNPLSIQHERHYDAYRAINDTANYDDVVSEMDIPFGCQSALMTGQGSMIGLAMLRGQRQGRCDDETLARFAKLSRHMLRAVRMQIALDGEAANLMLGDLDGLTSATMLFDRHGCLCAWTPAADELLDDGPIRIDALRPELRDRGHDRAFQHVLGRMMATAGAIGAVWRHRLPRWLLYLSCLPGRAHGLGFDPHLAITVKPIKAAGNGWNPLQASLLS